MSKTITMDKICELRINPYRDREAIVIALNNAGYATKVEERKEADYTISSDFYVLIYEVNA